MSDWLTDKQLRAKICNTCWSKPFHRPEIEALGPRDNIQKIVFVGKCLDTQCLYGPDIADKEKRCVFITIQTKQQTEKDIPKLIEFCQRSEYNFEQVKWMLEYGSVGRIHIHMLGAHVNSRKTKNNMKKLYQQFFNIDITQKDFWNVRSCNVKKAKKGMPSYEDFIKEKLEYFDDATGKGDHQNAKDLNIIGGHGPISTKGRPRTISQGHTEPNESGG